LGSVVQEDTGGNLGTLTEREFVRMPFGFENAPETLIRKLNKKEAKCFTHDRK
jgi:hypothetical protein